MLGDLKQRHAKILESEVGGTGCKIIVEVLLQELFGYASRLRDITQGRGSFYMELLRYEKISKERAEHY